MKDRWRDRIPPCIPHYYRFYLLVRKIYRQTAVRIQEAVVRAQGTPDGLLDDGETGAALTDFSSLPNPTEAINKCTRWFEEDLQQPEIRAIAEQILALKTTLTTRGLCVTNTAGNFLAREYHSEAERGKLWENAWLLRHANPAPGHTVLDVGGASTLFSFYLASRGCHVAVVDNDWANCGTLYNARYVARQMGWQLEVWNHDVSHPLPFTGAFFDRVFSVCVLEHLPPRVRQLLMQDIGRVLKPGGIAGFTVDYDVARPVLVTDKGLRFAYRDKLERDVIRPSGLAVYGNLDWVDTCPKRSFMGALFLQKPSTGPYWVSRTTTEAPVP